MNGVCGSAEAAMALMTSMKKHVSQLLELNHEIIGDVKRLRETCRDDSMDEMEYFVQSCVTQMGQLLPEVKRALQRLESYAAFIENMEAGILSQGGQKLQGVTLGKVRRTKQIWKQTDDGYVYDSPEELGKKLDIRQGKTGLGGSCGICSCENIIRISGTEISEGTVFQQAYQEGLCDPQGGTNAEERQQILAKYNIVSYQADQTMEQVKIAITEGRIVNLSVDARKLYGEKGLFVKPHSVIVTSVRTDEKGNLMALTICDSNAYALGDTGAKTYSVEEIENALIKQRKMLVTQVLR